MNKGTAILAIIIALVGGFALGNLTGTQLGKNSEEAEIDDDAARGASGVDDGIVRYQIPVTDEQPTKGPDDALVTIVEFSDFECPFCSRVLPTLTRLVDENKGKVRVVWRNQPLPMHQRAMPAHTAAMEAYEQGGDEKFWKMHDLLFANQRALSREDLLRYGKEIGLDVGKLEKALDSGEHKAQIQADQAIAAKVGANGTPHFFINGRKLAGAQPYEQFKSIVDDEIRRAEQLVGAGTSREQVYAALTKHGLTEEKPAEPAEPAAAQRRPDPDAIYKVPVGDDPQKGPDDALVTIVEFSDFECPFCGRVEPTLKQIEETYGNDVRVIWMNNPLPFHQKAMPAHIAAMEVYRQGGDKKFWQYHGLLFENQRAIAREDLERYAEQVGGINMAQFRQALDTNKHKATIEKQQQLALSLGASGTPSFFINGRNLRGAQPFASFKAAIDKELEKAREMVRKGTPRGRVYAEIIKNGATSQQFLEAAGGAGVPAEQPTYDIDVPRDAPRKGARNAKVVIQEFSDFQCPFCSRVLPTLNQVVEEYGDKVQIVWRNYPLPFHQEAGPAAQAAVEVHRQGGDAKFWAFHDLLFENQRALSRADLERYAEQIGGINMTQFRQALDTERHKERVQVDMDAVQKAGARIGTPSFFINGTLLQGAQPFPKFKEAIDKALADS